MQCKICLQEQYPKIVSITPWEFNAHDIHYSANVSLSAVNESHLL